MLWSTLCKHALIPNTRSKNFFFGLLVKIWISIPYVATIFTTQIVKLVQLQPLQLIQIRHEPVNTLGKMLWIPQVHFLGFYAFLVTKGSRRMSPHKSSRSNRILENWISWESSRRCIHQRTQLEQLELTDGTTGPLRITGFPDAPYRNNEDRFSQRGMTLFWQNHESARQKTECRVEVLFTWKSKD